MWTLPPTETPKILLMGQEQGPVGDWKRGVTLVKGAIGGVRSGDHSGENCFEAFKESYE